VSSVLLGEAIPSTGLPTKLIVAVDAFGFADADVAEALQPMVKRLGTLIGNSREEIMAPQGLSVWARAQRSLQPVEAYATFKDWLDKGNPRFAFSVAKALVMGSMTPQVDQTWAALMRQEVRGRLQYLLPAGTILCLPTTPFPAPLRGQPLSVLDPLRDRITCLCAHGGLAGHPQVNIPGATVGGLPVGLSIVGARGSDATLVAVAQALEKVS
jgi:amidase